MKIKDFEKVRVRTAKFRVKQSMQQDNKPNQVVIYAKMCNKNTFDKVIQSLDKSKFKSFACYDYNIEDLVEFSGSTFVDKVIFDNSMNSFEHSDKDLVDAMNDYLERTNQDVRVKYKISRRTINSHSKTVSDYREDAYSKLNKNKTNDKKYIQVILQFKDKLISTFGVKAVSYAVARIAVIDYYMKVNRISESHFNSIIDKIITTSSNRQSLDAQKIQIIEYEKN